MSRKLFAFLLSELKTIRIVCKQCHAASELSIAQTAMLSEYRCVGCKTEMRGRAYLQPMALQVQSLQTQKDDFDVEFVLPDTGSE